MTEIFELSHYSPEQVQAICQAWPAVNRYYPWLSTQPQTLTDELRLTRHRAWLRCAFATFFATASTEAVCRFWSQTATDLLTQAWQKSNACHQPAALFALGKLGAHELNLSSDVDLLIVRQDGSNVSFRQFREFQTLISDVTELGFCLRMDFDLRPGGRAGSPVPTESEFENHYGYYGETWERLALVRLKPICGDMALASRVLEKAHRFSFRKHLDFTLLEDLKLLRPRIHSSFHELEQNEFNLKLSRGGIRDVELFIHALQVLHGGKNPDLRTTSTTDAISKLIASAVYPQEEAQFLIETYWFYRNVENRLQARSDQQTYVVSSDDEASLQRPFFAEIQKRAPEIDQIVGQLLGRADTESASLPTELSEQQAWLKQLHFSDQSINTIWPELISTTAISRTKQRDERARLKFLRSFIEALNRIGLDQDLGLNLLRDFAKSIRAKATFFSLFLHEPKLIDEVAWLFSTSPYLGQLLASRPELLDSFIFRREDVSHLQDFDQFLDALADRRLLNEVIASTQFLSRRDLDELLSALTFTADEIATSLLQRLKQDFPTSQLQILSLGKWGGRELGLRSDLDFVFITPDAPKKEDHQVARRFISRISESHKAGAIYSVDLRLRPSGKAGPIISSESQLRDYLLNQADVWERQAYLRARPLYDTNTKFSAQTVTKPLTLEQIEELRRIRQALVKESVGDIDLKFNPGGLVDIEFSVQVAMLHKQLTPELGPSTLDMAKTLSLHDETWARLGEQLMNSYRELRLIEQIHQLTSHHSGASLRGSSESFIRLSRVFGTAPQDLFSQMMECLRGSQELLKHLDPVQASR